MSHMHGTDRFSRRSLLEEGINRLLVQSGFEEILKFRECLVDIRSQLDLQACPLFNGFLPKAAKGLEIHEIQVIKGYEPGILLQHQSLGNKDCVDFVRLRFADVILPQG